MVLAKDALNDNVLQFIIIIIYFTVVFQTQSILWPEQL